MEIRMYPSKTLAQDVSVDLWNPSRQLSGADSLHTLGHFPVRAIGFIRSH